MLNHYARQMLKGLILLTFILVSLPGYGHSKEGQKTLSRFRSIFSKQPQCQSLDYDFANTNELSLSSSLKNLYQKCISNLCTQPSYLQIMNEIQHESSQYALDHAEKIDPLVKRFESIVRKSIEGKIKDFKHTEEYENIDEFEDLELTKLGKVIFEFLAIKKQVIEKIKSALKKTQTSVSLMFEWKMVGFLRSRKIFLSEEIRQTIWQDLDDDLKEKKISENDASLLKIILENQSFLRFLYFFTCSGDVNLYGSVAYRDHEEGLKEEIKRLRDHLQKIDRLRKKERFILRPLRLELKNILRTLDSDDASITVEVSRILIEKNLMIDLFFSLRERSDEFENPVPSLIRRIKEEGVKEKIKLLSEQLEEKKEELIKKTRERFKNLLAKRVMIALSDDELNHLDLMIEEARNQVVNRSAKNFSKGLKERIKHHIENVSIIYPKTSDGVYREFELKLDDLETSLKERSFSKKGRAFLSLAQTIESASSAEKIIEDDYGFFFWLIETTFNINDYSLDIEATVNLDWMAAKTPYAPFIIRHELAHQIQKVIRDRGFSWSKDYAEYHQTYRRLEDLHPEKTGEKIEGLGIGKVVQMNLGFYGSEDYADFIASHPGSDFGGQAGCLVVDRSRPSSLKQASQTDHHSSSFFRAISWGIYSGQLPDSCMTYLKTKHPKKHFSYSLK